MIKLDNIKLKIALEFAPHGIVEDEVIDREINKSEDWLNKVFLTAGFDPIQPIGSKSWCVAIDDLTDKNLELYIKNHLKNEENNFMDQMSRLEGGVVMIHKGVDIFSPTCCTDLSDYVNWLDLKEEESFQQIWIGHPWLFYKVVKNSIYFTDYIEANAEDLTDANIKYQIELEQYKQQLIALQNEIADFEKRVRQCLIDLGEKDFEQITQCLVHGNCVEKEGF